MLLATLVGWKMSLFYSELIKSTLFHSFTIHPSIYRIPLYLHSPSPSSPPLLSDSSPPSSSAPPLACSSASNEQRLTSDYTIYVIIDVCPDWTSHLSRILFCMFPNFCLLFTHFPIQQDTFSSHSLLMSSLSMSYSLLRLYLSKQSNISAHLRLHRAVLIILLCLLPPPSELLNLPPRVSTQMRELHEHVRLVYELLHGISGITVGISINYLSAVISQNRRIHCNIQNQ